MRSIHNHRSIHSFHQAYTTGGATVDLDRFPALQGQFLATGVCKGVCQKGGGDLTDTVKIKPVIIISGLPYID